jgi:hypothetical protein
MRPIAFSESPVIEHLDAATIRGVAERLNSASTFEDFVYRESEMDALFTLADVALNERRGVNQSEDARHAELTKLRALIFAAHDFTHDSDARHAIELLEQAAQIAELGASG